MTCEAAWVVGEELRNNRHFILEAVRLQGAALEYVPHFQEDEAGSGGGLSVFSGSNRIVIEAREWQQRWK